MQTMSEITATARELARTLNELRGGERFHNYIGFTRERVGSEIFTRGSRPNCGLARIPSSLEPPVSDREAQDMIDAYYGDEG